MRAIPSKRRRSGFVLFEIMIVIWVMILILFLGTTTLLGALKIQKAAAAAFDRQTLRAIVADQFRADVALAATAPDEMEGFKAGPACLILRMTGDKRVIYRWHEGRLERAELVGRGAAPYWVALGGTLETAAFTRSGTEKGRVILTFKEPLQSKTTSHLVEIAAALGGDLR
jgi:hypothetical protein